MITRALQNTGWLMGARGINAVLSLVYLALATRPLGVAGFGRSILAVMFAQVVVGLASFQTWQAVVRWGQNEALLVARGRAIFNFALRAGPMLLALAALPWLIAQFGAAGAAAAVLAATVLSVSGLVLASRGR